MAILNDFRFKPGTRVRDKYDGELMVMRLPAGMIRSGDTSGGEYTVAVVNLKTGIASFEDSTLEVTVIS